PDPAPGRVDDPREPAALVLALDEVAEPVRDRREPEDRLRPRRAERVQTAVAPVERDLRQRPFALRPAGPEARQGYPLSGPPRREQPRHDAPPEQREVAAAHLDRARERVAPAIPEADVAGGVVRAVRAIEAERHRAREIQVEERIREHPPRDDVDRVPRE